MATSPAHKFGQIIGGVLESAVEALLQEIALKHNLYLDKKGRRVVRPGNKVSWRDLNGNTHDLDFVLERGGSTEHIGIPTAFVEVAWRRYTKHSRNKAQEIQGAILPLVATYQDTAPFMGAILGGVFTQGALTQLKSLGFSILYFPYDTIISSFASVGLDAAFDEDTLDTEFMLKIKQWEALTDVERRKVTEALVTSTSGPISQFMSALEAAITRRVDKVRVIFLYGSTRDWTSVEEAIAFVESYDEQDRSGSFVRYEVEVNYVNGDKVSGKFAAKQSAVGFLRTFSRPI